MSFKLIANCKRLIYKNIFTVSSKLNFAGLTIARKMTTVTLVDNVKMPLIGYGTWQVSEFYKI